MAKRLQIHAHRSNYGSRIELYVSQDSPSGGFAVPQEVVFVEAHPDEYREPTFRIDVGAAQELMDALWSAGLRPTAGNGSAGALQATEAHLSDMRRIAFSVLKLDGEGAAHG